MKIQLRYFASLREALGSGEALDVAAGTTVGALRDTLIARGEPYARPTHWPGAARCVLRSTRRMCAEATELADGAEVAFFPPVTGG